MQQTVVFLDSDHARAEQLASGYRERGWHIECMSPCGAGALEKIAQARPRATVFSLRDDSADFSRALAGQVISDKRDLRPLFVFVGGDTDQVAQAKATVPFGVFVSEPDLPWALRGLS